MGNKIEKEKNKDEYNPILVWIDQNVNNEENSIYKKQINEILQNIKIYSFEKVSNAITRLKEIKFNKTLIICSGRDYPEYIKIFTKEINKFMICPKTIIFTSNKFAYLNRNEKNTDLKINNAFYNPGGVEDDFIEILKFIENEIDKKILLTKSLQIINNQIKLENELKIPQIDAKENEDKIQYNFECISEKNQLIAPIYFLDYMKEPDGREVKKFNYYIREKYSKDICILNIFSQLIECDQIPNEIVSKFWLRAFTFEENFYKEMNKDLRLGIINNYYAVYIQMMYEGVKKNWFSFKPENRLYRGTYFSKEEITLYENYLNSKDKNLLGIIVYSKSFLSFSLEKKVAMKFKINTLLIIEEFKEEQNLCSACADISKFSYIPEENEILFFPFSSFEFKKIKKKKENYYKIYLGYLGKYKKLFEGENKKDLILKIRDSKYAEDIFSSNLVEEEYQSLFNKRSKENNGKILGEFFGVKNGEGEIEGEEVPKVEKKEEGEAEGQPLFDQNILNINKKRILEV